MKTINRTFSSAFALALAAGFSLPALAQDQGTSTQPETPFHATQMQPASPQAWDPMRVESAMQQLDYDEISNVRQEGEQWLADARRDGDEYALTFDPATGDVRDDSGETVGNLNEVSEAAGGTGETSGTSTQDMGSNSDTSDPSSGASSGQ